MLIAIVLYSACCWSVPQDHLICGYPDGDYLLFTNVRITIRLSAEGKITAIGPRWSALSNPTQRKREAALQGVWISRGLLFSFDNQSNLEQIKEIDYSIGVKGDLLSYVLEGHSITGVMETTASPLGFVMKYVSPLLGSAPLDDRIQFRRYCIAISTRQLLVITRNKYTLELSVWSKEIK